MMRSLPRNLRHQPQTTLLSVSLLLFCAGACSSGEGAQRDSGAASGGVNGGLGASGGTATGGLSSSGGTGGTTGSGGALVSSGGTNDQTGGAGGSPTGGAGTGGMGTGGEALGTGGDGSGGAEGPTLPPTDDYSAPGPFSTTIETGEGPDGSYTVFRPDPLSDDGFLHAPIIFGPGINQTVDVHTQMLTNFASHGFVVVGTPVLDKGPGDESNRAKMQAGLDWILAQNEASGTYQGKLWVDHAISMGFSVGGTSAVEIGGDPAVFTVVSIHGHAASAELHGPLLQTTGTDDPLGMDLQEDTYDLSQVPTFLATLTDAEHSYIEKDGGGDERPAIVAWMRYWIYSDDNAEGYFFGDDCVLCMSPWENPRRKNWDAP